MNMPDPRSTLDEQAAYWFLRLREDDVELDEIEAALDWQDESDAHREAFERVVSFWRRSNELEPSRRPDLLRGVKKPRRRYGYWGGAAAAAALVIAIAGISAVHLDLGGSAVAIRPVAVESHTQPTVASVTDEPLKYTTTPGQNRTVVLADGSQVVLGGASSVSVSYSTATRRIELTAGEALFRVQKDPARPFLVDANGGETQAVGTIFDVHRGLEAVTVTVVEGVVRVQPDIPEGNSESTVARIAAGHQVSYSTRGTISPIREASAVRATAWRDGELTFVDRSLADVVIDLNRYSSRPIKIDDETIKGLRITGMVTVAKMDEWLRALEKDVPIQIVATKDSLILTKRTGADTAN